MPFYAHASAPYRNIYNTYCIYLISWVDLTLRDNTPAQIKKFLSTEEVLNIDFSIRSKAAEWGEEENHIQYLIENRKKWTNSYVKLNGECNWVKKWS